MLAVGIVLVTTANTVLQKGLQLKLVDAISLGILQGLTEFLPVSSSGHLVLLQNLFGLKEPELLFDICLHLGTLLAIIVVFSKEIQSILQTLVHLPRIIRSSKRVGDIFSENDDVKITALIIIGSVPTACLGVLFHEISDQIFGAIWIVGLMLVVTGTLLWMTRQAPLDGRRLKKVNGKDALVIGFAQGLAILPGISRSGSTISTALFLGVDRDLAGRYSFLLSIPAILGALVLHLGSPDSQTSISSGTIVIGTFTAAIVGYFALKVLLHIIKQGQIYYFSPYCWAVGVTALVWSWF